MNHKKELTLNGEPARPMDIKAAVSLISYDDVMDEETRALMDTDVKRAVTYNEIVINNMLKRVIAYGNKPSAQRSVKERTIATLFKNERGLTDNQKVYFQENPTPEHFSFLKNVMGAKKKVRGYTEYILYTIISHFQHYTRN